MNTFLKSLAQYGGAAFDLTMIMTVMFPQFITVDAFINITIVFEIQSINLPRPPSKGNVLENVFSKDTTE